MLWETKQTSVCPAGLHTSVVGVPKTIDGDLKNAQVATSFGFDTACKVRPDLTPYTAMWPPSIPGLSALVMLLLVVGHSLKACVHGHFPAMQQSIADTAQ